MRLKEGDDIEFFFFFVDLIIEIFMKLFLRLLLRFICLLKFWLFIIYGKYFNDLYFICFFIWLCFFFYCYCYDMWCFYYFFFLGGLFFGDSIIFLGC